MSDAGMPGAARVALCNRMGLRHTRADPVELDATISVITAPVAARLLRLLSLRIDGSGDLLMWAREIEQNPAVLLAALRDELDLPEHPPGTNDGLAHPPS